MNNAAHAIHKVHKSYGQSADVLRGIQDVFEQTIIPLAATVHSPHGENKNDN
jgi:hypothetical protein